MIKAMKQGVSRTIKESEIATYQNNGFTIFKDGKEVPDKSDKELKKENKELAKKIEELEKQNSELTGLLETSNAELNAAKVAIEAAAELAK